MDIPEARSHSGREGMSGTRIEESHLRTSGFEGNDVDIEIAEDLSNITEIGVAHMRMDLGFGEGARYRETNAGACPAQISLVVFLPQRKPFAERRFIHLDHANARSLEITNF